MEESLGYVAYEGYMIACNSRSLISGDPLPSWEDQDPRIREAWNVVAEAVLRRDRERRSDD